MDTTEREILAAIDGFVNAQNRQDVPAILRFLHEAAPMYAQTQQALLQYCARFRIESTVLRKRFVAADGDYAYARLALATRKLEGPAFRDNRSDTLLVFKRSGAGWLIWNQSLLDIGPLE